MTQKKVEISQTPVLEKNTYFINNWVFAKLDFNNLKNKVKRTTICLLKDLHKKIYKSLIISLITSDNPSNLCYKKSY